MSLPGKRTMHKANDKIVGRALINHAKYPIDEPGHPLRQAAVEQVQSALDGDGCALLTAFLSEYGLTMLLNEALARRQSAYFSRQTDTNAYFSPPDPTLPDNHPVNILMSRTNGFITSDQFDDRSMARQLYRWPSLGQFLADCLGKPNLHLYDDPISNMIVNVCPPGTRFNWHFDTNEFTITMLLKPARSGGYFEYVPHIRTPRDERYQDVANVLLGDRQQVTQLVLEPGDLQFFLGRFSLHQVTENTGTEDRLLLIMSFTEQSGLIGSRQRVKQLYGKLSHEHQRQRLRNDTLRD